MRPLTNAQAYATAAAMGLLPLGLIMFGCLALPGVAIASLAAAARRRALARELR